MRMGKLSETQRTCYSCNKVGHVAKDCPKKKPVTCHECGELGHKKRDCNQRTCYKCGEKGHYAVDCETEICSRCFETGHIAFTCRKPRPRCNLCRYSHRPGGKCPDNRSERKPRQSIRGTHKSEKAPRPELDPQLAEITNRLMKISAAGVRGAGDM